MNVFNRFGARTIFFAFVAIFCALAISEGTEAEYYDKSSIWTGDMDGTIVDSNGMEKGYNFHSYSERFLDVSSDGRHFAVGGSTTEYLSDEDEVRTGYHILGNYNYNRSIPANVFHECIIGNDYYWGGDCSSISVKISGDGKYIAAIISERPNCRNQGIYDEVDRKNATGPCKDFYTEEQMEEGWSEGWSYSGYRNTLKLVIYDRLSGNLMGEYVFCYNNGYKRDSYEYIYCAALAQSWDASKLKISDDGESVIVAFQNVDCYACGDDGGEKYINELFGFTVSDINDGPDWHYIYSNRLYEVDISNDGDTVLGGP